MNTPRERRLADLVAREAMHWGVEAKQGYHDIAARLMDEQWRDIVWPVLSRHPIDLSTTMDFACGYGRNARKLRQAGAGPITLVDVHPHNIAYCEAHLTPLGGYETFLNNGFDLDGLPAGKFTHVYSFDAMVHFDIEIMLSYIAEFARVLKPLGTAFLHHSNYAERPGARFQDNPHWRNFMSDAIVRHAAIRNGFDILEQQTLDWRGERIDCLTVLRRRNDDAATARERSS